ncbi:MAG: hypothetical protein ACK5H0_08870 [Bacteroidota bacterium]
MPRAPTPERFGAGALIAGLPAGRSTVVISLDGYGTGHENVRSTRTP